MFLISIGVRVAEVVRRAFAEKFGFGRKFLALTYAFAIEFWIFAIMSKSDAFVAKTANTRMATIFYAHFCPCQKAANFCHLDLRKGGLKSQLLHNITV